MKSAVFILAAALIGCAPDQVALQRGRTEVLVAPDAPKTVLFAADEMTNFLSRVFGADVPIVTSPTPGRVSISLGRNEWSRAAGLEPEKLPRDGFCFKAEAGRVYIAGVDDPDADLRALVASGRLGGSLPTVFSSGEHATLFGVYEFLERFAGCRLYFPGELGEVVPRKDSFSVPFGELKRQPAFTVRNIYLAGDGKWPGARSDEERNRTKALDWLRLRLQTESIPCCHGLNDLQFSDRFGETHPEWFHMTRNPVTGKLYRETGVGKVSYGSKNQMCFTNDELWDQVFSDVKAYFDGEDPAKRGIKRVWNSRPSGWGPNFSGRFVDVMAQDGMQECLCDKCQAAYDKSLGIPGYATELFWGRTAQLARRLSDAGYPAIVTQMSYTPYSTIPKCDLPSNVWVMVARQGPWAVGNPAQLERQKADVKAWADKLGHKIWMWTYPAKHPESELGMAGPPDWAPRAWFRYYKEMAPWSMGTFAESESVNSIIHYMNYYVFSRLAWDLDVDIDALMSEHFTLMYGAGAAPMSEAFETFERKWIGEIVGKSVETLLGPRTQVPSRAELWGRVYSKAELDRLSGLFDAARDAVPEGSIEARRIALMRENFLDPLLAEGLKAVEMMSVEKAQARRKANPPKRNIVVNGSFDPDGGGWNKPTGLCGYDTSTFVSPPASFRVANTNGVGWSTCMQNVMGKLKDDTEYKVSFFVKLDSVQRLQPRGHSCWIIAFYDTWYCKPHGGEYGSLLGTADWFYCEGKFKTKKRSPETKVEPYIAFGFNGHMTGTAWIDDLVVEEVVKEEDCAPGQVALQRGKTEVLVAPDAPKTVLFAAGEMTNFLSRVFGAAVPIVTSPTSGRVSISLGRNEWSKAAGLEPEKLPRDGFCIKAEAGRVCIAGVDDPKADLKAVVDAGLIEGPPPTIAATGERGTLFGVYEFLERFAGCRFYFPGELGEVVPRKDSFTVPLGELKRQPAFTVRNVYMGGDGSWPGERSVVDRNRMKATSWLRLRLQTEGIPCCHGLNDLQLTDRFAKTHPEWFHMAKDRTTGKLYRDTGVGKSANGHKNQMCFTNDGLWDQIFSDIKAYFDGEDPAKRGIKRVWNSRPSGWGPNFSGRFVDVMAQDGMQECLCDKCQAAYDKSLGIPGYATELFWGRTAQLARRLSDAGYPAIVTQMSYTPYSMIPKCDLPSNVWVMVARHGPWSVGNPAQMERQKADVKAWAEKLGHKVWMWTYPMKSRTSELGMAGPPDWAPRAWHRYYKEMAPWSMGSFAESESVNAIIHYMNYYAFAKLGWDLDVDIDALLAEHFALMYGAGAAPMSEAFETFERKWIGEIAGKSVDTPLGPRTQVPSKAELWSNVYPQSEIDRLRGLFDAARDAVPAGSIEARRIAFMRENFLEPLLVEGKKAAEMMSVKNEQARRKANPPERNIVVNGSFDPDGGGWNKPSGLCGYDTSTFVSAPASFRISNTNGVGWSTCMQKMTGKLKDDTEYRASFFVKLDNVKRLQRVGFSCWLITYYDTWYCLPHGGATGSLLGTADWFHCEVTFKTGKRSPDMKAEPYIAFGFNGNMTGTAWIDDLVVEEVVKKEPDVLKPDHARPYEMVDAGRDVDEIKPWIDFEKDTGWRARAPAGGSASAYVSDERRTFGKGGLGVHFQSAPEVRVEPPKPLPLPTRDFEWFGAWIWGDQSNYTRAKRLALDYGLVFALPEGGTTNIQLRLRNYDKVLGWQGWNYVVRRFKKDELALLRRDGVRFAGFYLNGATNDVPRSVYFDNLAFFRRDESTPLSFRPLPDIPLPNRPEGALPDSARPGGKNSVRKDGDATVFSYDGPDGRLEYVWRGRPDTLEARWNGGPAFRPAARSGAVDRPAAAKYEASIRGKTLVVDVSAPAGESLVSVGRPEGAKVLSRTPVASYGDGYEWEGSKSLVTALDAGGSKVFALAFADWYMSHASRMGYSVDAPGITNCACHYLPKTDGVRNPVRERIYVTVAPEFMETLPVIANPPSPWRSVVGSHAWCAYGSSADREFDKAFWRNLHRYGVRNVTINDHECCMRDEGESFTFRDKPAPRKGGDKGMRDYADCLIRELGYLYGPYNNFTDFAPVNANWRLDRVCRDTVESFFAYGEMVYQHGDLKPAWMRCYAPKPLYALEACEKYAPILARKFGFNTAYCDVHTAVLPWNYVDFDARVPGAAMFQTTYKAYAAILLEQKKAWNGPVYSEGGSHFYYAGFSDGNYAQLRINPEKDPWIVDFDLRRIHPLEIDFGCGNLAMFSGKIKGKTDSPDFEKGVDWFQAATLAFGHAPYLLQEAMFEPRNTHARGYAGKNAKYVPETGLPFVLRSYFMISPVSARHATADVSEILYLGDDGKWRGVSGAVLHGGTINQVAVSYGNGTHVVANGDRSRRLKSTVFGRKVDLPPCGYAAWSDDGSLEMASSDAGGSRTDYCAWSDGIYFDTRSSAGERTFPKARGRGIAVCRREGGGWEVIPVRGTCAFRIDGERAVALDRDRRELGPAEIVRDSDGYLGVVPRKDAFSYLVLPRK